MTRLETTIKVDKRGQAVIEFTFSMIIVLLMAFAVIMIFHWTGQDLATRQRNFDDTLIGAPGTATRTLDTNEVRGLFYKPIKMNAVYGEM